MRVPVQVTFQSMWPSDEVMEIVQKKSEGLQSSHGRIERCRVTIDRPRRRKGKGRKYRVNVVISTQDGDFSTQCKTEAVSEHARLQTALSQAFHVLGTRLSYQCLPSPRSKPVPTLRRPVLARSKSATNMAAA